uniref:Uncharacterized protein n=1 Tax=Oryza brachyantha TaxID=4533 RepID=J3N846_ORYBR
MKVLLLHISVLVTSFLLSSSGTGTGSLIAAHGTTALVEELTVETTEAAAAVEITAAVYPERRVLQGSGKNIGYMTLDKSRPACPNPCSPARGGRYTGRGCKSRFQCIRCSSIQGGENPRNLNDTIRACTKAHVFFVIGIKICKGDRCVSRPSERN